MEVIMCQIDVQGEVPSVLMWSEFICQKQPVCRRNPKIKKIANIPQLSHSVKNINMLLLSSLLM